MNHAEYLVIISETESYVEKRMQAIELTGELSVLISISTENMELLIRNLIYTRVSKLNELDAEIRHLGENILEKIRLRL